MANFSETHKTIGSPDDNNLEYNFRRLTGTVTNIIKPVINQTFYTDVVTAYAPGEASTFSSYLLSSNSPSIVKQANYVGEICATGELVRAVFSDYKQTFFIKVTGGAFSADNGPIFNNGRGLNGVEIVNGSQNIFSYGSSIKSVRYITSVQKITAYFSDDECSHYNRGTSSTDCATGKLFPEKHYFDYGTPIIGNNIRIRYGGTFTGGTSYTQQNQTYNNFDIRNIPIYSYGKILSVIVGTGSISLIVEVNQLLEEDVVMGGTKDYGFHLYYIEETQEFPCARYRIDRVETLVDNNIIQEIVFSDINPYTYNPTYPGQAAYKVIQYDPSTSILRNGQEHLSRSEGNALGWSAANRSLYVQCVTGIFRKEGGSVYQLDSSGIMAQQGLGGNGYDLTTSDFNKKTGFFVNIDENYKGDFTEGENVVQRTEANTTWWSPSHNYQVGSKVRQYITEDDYVTGTVVKWTAPKSDTESFSNPPKLIIEVEDKSKPFRFFPGSSKIVPESYIYDNVPDWFYDVNTAFVETPDITYVNPSQLVGSRVEFERIMDTKGDETFGGGAKVEPSGQYLGTLVVTPIGMGSGIYNGLYGMGISNIKPATDHTIGSVITKITQLKFGSNRDDGGSGGYLLFEISNGSVKYNKVLLTAVSTELRVGDILLNSSDKEVAKIVSIFEKGPILKTELIVEREIDSPLLVASDVDGISKILRSKLKYTLNTPITIASIDPYAEIYIGNTSSTRLVYPLQVGKYFNKVSSTNTTQNYTATKSFYITDITASNNTISGEEIANGSLTSGGPGSITYFNNSSAVVTTTDNISQDTQTKVITLDSVSGVSTSNKAGIFTAKFNVSCNTHRLKNLESRTETRRLKYDNGRDEFYLYLTKSDVYDITSMFYSTTNVFDYFGFFNGETNDAYGFGKLFLRKDKESEFISKVGAGTRDDLKNNLPIITITYQYFEHSGFGPVTRESYTYGTGVQMLLDDIGFYRPETGGIMHKSAVVDFRPVEILLNNFSLDNNDNPRDHDKFSLAFSLTPDNKFAINNEHYLGRIDKLYLNKDGIFSVDAGISSIQPIEPATDSKRGMLLYTLNIPPYTTNLKEIGYSAIDNRRYTMRDIGKLDKRISDIEYYTVLSLLEKEATDLIVKDANGLTREKNGIVVDSFIGHSVGDVYNIQYNACVNPKEGYLRPPFKPTRLALNTLSVGDFSEQMSQTAVNMFGLTTVGSGLYILTHSGTESFIIQPLATQTVLITALDSFQHQGDLVLRPSGDDWIDTTIKPTLKVNLNGANDAIEAMSAALFNNNIAPFGTYYSDWNTTQTTVVGEPFRQARGRSMYEITNLSIDQQRTETQREITGRDTQIDLGDRVTDVSSQPYMRAKTITIYGTGLRPNTKVYVFFDDVDVREYCKYKSGSSYVPFVGDPLSFPKTDKDGNIQIEFKLPGKTFGSGDKKFIVTDNVANDRTDTNTTTYASGKYIGTGLNIVKQSTSATVRDYDFTTTVEQERRTVAKQTSKFLYSWDPLAQTFFVNADLYPDGIYLESVDLCFSTKDKSIPVKLEVRPVVNGYPDVSRIYPNGVSVVKAKNVIALNDSNSLPDIEDSSKFTKFKFDVPVYLAPGEHSFVVRAESREYALYTAKLGESDVRDEDLRVLVNPYSGVFFRSANASTWQADGSTDMMFKMNKLIFDSAASPSNPRTKTITLSVDTNETEFNPTFEGSSTLTFELYNMSIKAADYPNCRVTYTPSYFDGTSTITTSAVPLNTDIILGKPGKLSSANGFNVLLNVHLTNPHISPIIDLERSGVIFIRNMVDPTEVVSGSVISGIIANEKLPFAPIKAATASNTAPSTCRYITRQVNLTPGFDAKNIKVLLTAYKPTGAEILVFLKSTGSLSGGNFSDEPYTQLTLNGNNFISTDESDYREMEFNLPEDIAAFDKFSIKICLFTSNSCVIPRVKDMRAIAVQ